MTLALFIVCLFLLSLSLVYAAPVRSDTNDTSTSIHYSDDHHTPDVPIEAQLPPAYGVSGPRPFMPHIKNRIWEPIPTLAPTRAPPPTPRPSTLPPTTLPPTIPGPTQQPTLKPPSTAISPSITYHYGPLVSKGVPKVWFVYYGNWATLDPLAEPLITYFTSHLSQSALYNIMSTYYDNTGGQTTYLGNQINYGGSYMDTSYSYGTSISDAQVYYIIRNAMTNGHIPFPDSTGTNMYFVLSSPDVTGSSGLCTNYCGWHTGGSFNGKAAPYGYIGSSIRCSGCMAFSQLGSPNNAPNADSMISVIWHEITEAVTDPYFTGWYDTNGEEVADRYVHIVHVQSCHEWAHKYVYVYNLGAAGIMV